MILKDIERCSVSFKNGEYIQFNYMFMPFLNYSIAQNRKC